MLLRGSTNAPFYHLLPQKLPLRDAIWFNQVNNAALASDPGRATTLLDPTRVRLANEGFRLALVTLLFLGGRRALPVDPAKAQAFMDLARDHFYEGEFRRAHTLGLLYEGILAGRLPAEDHAMLSQQLYGDETILRLFSRAKIDQYLTTIKPWLYPRPGDSSDGGPHQ